MTTATFITRDHAVSLIIIRQDAAMRFPRRLPPQVHDPQRHKNIV